MFLLRVSIHTTFHSAPTHFALGIISARGAAAPPNPNHKKPHQLLSSQLSSPQPSPLALVAAALMPPRLLGRCSCCGYGCGAGRLAELPRELRLELGINAFRARYYICPRRGRGWRDKRGGNVASGSRQHATPATPGTGCHSNLGTAVSTRGEADCVKPYTVEKTIWC